MVFMGPALALFATDRKYCLLVSVIRSRRLVLKTSVLAVRKSTFPRPDQSTSMAPASALASPRPSLCTTPWLSFYRLKSTITSPRFLDSKLRAREDPSTSTLPKETCATSKTLFRVLNLRESRSKQQLKKTLATHYQSTSPRS